jgi:hypothetical protein
VVDASLPLMEIVTPSYAPDFELCRDLVASVRRHAIGLSEHRIIVPARDRSLFDELSAPSVRIQTVEDILPRAIAKIPGVNMWLNWRAPFPPVRGWIAQQVVKLAAAAQSRAEGVLLVDSDIVFVRGFSMSDYSDGLALTIYRLAGGVHQGMTRHLEWDRVARRLLELPPAPHGDLPDYICCPCLWRPSVVRELLERVSHSGNGGWATLVARQMHFSEMALYGTFVDEVLSPDVAVHHRQDMRCLNHYEEAPLGERELVALLSRIRPTDVAVMVSAKSGTELDVRRRVFASLDLS